MELFINNKSGAPIYDQIYNQIKQQIISGRRAGRRWLISSVRPSSRRWAMSVRPAPLRGKPSPRWQPSSSTRWPQK